MGIQEVRHEVPEPVVKLSLPDWAEDDDENTAGWMFISEARIALAEFVKSQEAAIANAANSVA